jgi:chlorite dismutase
MSTPAYAPETLEGWYVLHQMFSVERAALRGLEPAAIDALRRDFEQVMQRLSGAPDAGWSAVIPLVGSRADVMFMHLRPTLDALHEAQQALLASPFMDFCDLAYSFLSVTEAGMYAATTASVRAAQERGGKVGDDAYRADLQRRLDAERASEHTQKRLYPPAPSAQMPYVCFYPMDKKREAGQNWYVLPIEERNTLMRDHGLTGRKYAGRVFQVVTGSMGFDAWEWGVTLYAADPIEFKKIVAEMRFDEASSKYGEFGEFFVGKVATAREWLDALRLLPTGA